MDIVITMADVDAANHIIKARYSKVIKRLAKDFDLPVKVSYIGGVFQNARQYILPYLQNYLGDQYEIISPIHTPEYGAYKLIKKLK